MHCLPCVTLKMIISSYAAFLRQSSVYVCVCVDSPLNPSLPCGNLERGLDWLASTATRSEEKKKDKEQSQTEIYKSFLLFDPKLCRIGMW